MGVVKCFNRECHYHDIEMVDNCSHPIVERSKCKDAVLRKEDDRRGGNNHYLRDLMSNECLCGKTKKKGHSFCYEDFKALPQDLKNDLYSRMGDGYEQAYDAAVKWLEENVW